MMSWQRQKQAYFHTKETGIHSGLMKYSPIVLQLIKEKPRDMQEEWDKRKFFAPVWVGMLMKKLDSSEPLSGHDYTIYKSMVAQLKLEDYKICTDNIFGYEVCYISSNEILKTISALKNILG